MSSGSSPIDGVKLSLKKYDSETLHNLSKIMKPKFYRHDSDYCKVNVLFPTGNVCPDLFFFSNIYIFIPVKSLATERTASTFS